MLIVEGIEVARSENPHDEAPCLSWLPGRVQFERPRSIPPPRPERPIIAVIRRRSIVPCRLIGSALPSVQICVRRRVPVVVVEVIGRGVMVWLDVSAIASHVTIYRKTL